MKTIAVLAVIALTLWAGAATTSRAEPHPELGPSPPPLAPALPPIPPAAAAPGTLAKMLATAKPGAVLKLRSATYSQNDLKDLSFSPPVTIESADPANPTVLSDLHVANSNGLAFDGLVFVAPLINGGSPDGRTAKPTMSFFVEGSAHVAFDKDRFIGEAGGTLASEPGGLIIERSTDVAVTNSDFSHLHNALGHWLDDRVKIEGNAFHDLRDDAIRGGSNDIVVADNHCYSNHPDGQNDPDHPDCIQFWNGTGTPMHDIQILNNRYDRGSGTPTQCVFMNDVKFPDSSDSHERVTVEGNVCHGASGNGILIRNATDVTIQNNVILSGCDVLSRIVTRNDSAVKVVGNQAPRYIIDDQFSRSAPSANALNACGG